MNLGKIKSFLIYLFLVINIYLVVSLVRSTEFKIDNATVDNTVSILSNSGITVDKNIIPKKTKNLKNIETVNVIYTDAFKKSKNYKEFSVSGDRFSYTQQNDGLYRSKDKKIKKYVKKFLEDSGFNLDYMTFSKIENHNGEKILNIACTVRNYRVFDSVITVKIDDTSLKLEGIWYEPQTNNVFSNSRTRSSVYITSVLIDLSYNEKFNNGSKKITSIEFGYMSSTLYGNKGHITATALPYYKITDSNKNIYYYDASDGTYNYSVSK